MSIEAMKLALEALEGINDEDRDKGFLTLKQFVRLDMATEALRTAIQQAESEPVLGPTTYQQRFTEVVSLLCRASPPADMVEGWLTPDADDHRLQEWAIEHAPNWSQGIGVLDAAHVMADQPAEGDEHEMRNTHPVPSVPDDVVRDAISTVREQYRGTDWGKAAECVCDAIDAAMLAAQA